LHTDSVSRVVKFISRSSLVLTPGNDKIKAFVGSVLDYLIIEIF
jgi:hypothetical protein